VVLKLRSAGKDRHTCALFPQAWVMSLGPDQATFTRNGVNSLHSLHEWALKNPNSTLCCSFQQKFSNSVLAGIVDSNIIGSNVIENSLYGIYHADFLERRITPLLQYIPLNILWWYVDTAQYFSCQVHNWLNNHYLGAVGIQLSGLHLLLIWAHFTSSYEDETEKSLCCRSTRL
jgi:hypothetical protein